MVTEHFLQTYSLCSDDADVPKPPLVPSSSVLIFSTLVEVTATELVSPPLPVGSSKLETEEDEKEALAMEVDEAPGALVVTGLVGVMAGGGAVAATASRSSEAAEDAEAGGKREREEELTTMVSSLPAAAKKGQGDVITMF